MADPITSHISNNPSQFNAAYDNLSKLFGWLYEADRWSEQENYYRMKKVLDNVWKIMDMFIKEREKDWQVKFYDLRRRINDILKIYSYMELKVIDHKTINDRNVLSKIKLTLGDLCDEYELMLRDLIHFKNMDLPEKEDITMAVLED